MKLELTDGQRRILRHLEETIARRDLEQALYDAAGHDGEIDIGLTIDLLETMLDNPTYCLVVAILKLTTDDRHRDRFKNARKEAHGDGTEGMPEQS